MTWELIFFCMSATGIAAGCLMPAAWLPRLPNDKLLHFLAFGGLTLIACRISPDWQHMQYWLLGLLVAGWGVEVLQNLVPGRKFCWRDMAANAAGIAIAALCSLLIRNYGWGIVA
ncbi:MAG: VanZ family protein [Pseudomonadota bacterium]